MNTVLCDNGNNMLVGNINGESNFAGAVIRIVDNLKGSRFPVQSPYKYLRKSYPKFGKWQYNRVIKRLKENKKNRVFEQNGKMFLELTKKGRLAALLGKLDIDKNKKWDGRWRLMIWDIPETSNKQRDAIRRFVKKLGFYRLQLSVYIIPFELPTAAVQYLIDSGLWKFIRFLRVDRLDDERGSKKHFGL